MSLAANVTAGRNNGRKRPKGYAAWSPRPAALALLSQVGEVLELYESHLPLTVRQIFYALVGGYGYEKSERAYRRLGDYLVRARRSRRIPFETIRDDGPVTYSPTWYADPESFLDDAAVRLRDYRRDRQAGQAHYLELWCETVGMAPQLARVAADYSVPVHSTGGFASLTAIHLIADRALQRNVPTIILHVGDYDPSGQSIFDTIVEDAAAFVLEDATLQTQRLSGVRVALTADQVEAFGLPTAPATTTDGRAGGWSGGTCQLEALPPDRLAALVVDAIRSRLDLDRVRRICELEERDRDELWRALPAGGAS